MVTTPAIAIRVDDRARLLAAALSATTFPDLSQARRKHGTHAHARATRKLALAQQQHPAITALQGLLDLGIPLPALFSYVLRLSWPGLKPIEDTPRWVPPGWHDLLHDFYEQLDLAVWWMEESEQWQTPVSQLQAAFASVDLYGFLQPFVGPITEHLVFMPNISYPTDETIGCRVGGDLIAIMPPPLAWGDSAPWPYKEDPALAYRAALGEFGTTLMNAYLSQHADAVRAAAEKPLPVDEAYKVRHPAWQDQFLGLFKSAITALFLEKFMGKSESRSYVQYMQRIEHLSVLPGAMNVFQRYLDEHQAGRYPDFIHFLPNVPKYLRVLKVLAPT
jgi:hypothetical protein